MLKKILIGLAVLVAVIGGAVYFLLSNVGAIVQAAIEKIGSEATKAEVKVAKVDIALKEGSGRIEGLKVGNPAGYATASAFSLGQAQIRLDIASLGKTDGPIIIKEMIIEAPAVTYERGEKGGNLETLAANAKAYADQKTGGAGSSAPKDKKAADKDGRKLVIERLVFREGKVAASHVALKGKTLALPLPAFELKDLGKSKGGASPGEIAEEVVNALTQQTSRATTAELDKALREGLQQVGEKAGQAIGDALKGLLGGKKN
ncbi:MAG: hypothetical protein FJX47_02620 [Alphaproteobacteria bacterium]|nr:hypothetical protein [Alphaproteobacteria bacterium]